MNKLQEWLVKNSGKILAGMIGLYVLIMTGVCLWKYQNFLYDGLDLAIYNNALWNTVHGHWWWSSIQGHNYWGDHFEPILILVLPLYYLWQSPILLLILQTLALGLAGWPIYLIVKKIYSYPPRVGKDLKNINIEHGIATLPRKTQCGVARNDRFLSLGLAFLWLINPLVHNINLYEFHAIAFLPFLFFFLFYFYLQLKEKPINKKVFLPARNASKLSCVAGGCFCAFVFLCLLVREDVAFIILAFLSIIWLGALKNKNKILLRVASSGLLVTFLYLIFSFQIIGHFSPSGFSPFAYYYGWLKSTNAMAIIRHLLTLTNLEMVLGFLAPFFFLPVIKPKWLLVSVIPLAQIIFSAAGGGAQVWQIHYGALFLPALALAFIFAWPRANEVSTQYFKDAHLLFLVIVIFNLALWPSFGPWATQNKPQVDGSVARLMSQQIEPEASVLASFRLLPNLSSRAEIYAAHYYFLGQQQFAQAGYVLGEEPQYIILDKSDYQYYDEILRTSAWAGRYYDQGYQRLEQLLSGYKKIGASDTIDCWQKE